MHKNLRLAFMFPFDIISEQRERESITSQKCQCLPMFWLQDYAQYFTALLKNTQILKFKSQMTFEFFAAVSHLSRPFRKQNFTLTGSKGHGLWFVIGRFRSFLCFCVSMFVACDGDYDWRQQRMQFIVKVAFEL